MGFYFKKSSVTDPIGNTPEEQAVLKHAQLAGEFLAKTVSYSGNQAKEYFDHSRVISYLEQEILGSAEWKELEASKEEVCIDEGSYAKAGLSMFHKTMEQLTTSRS